MYPVSTRTRMAAILIIAAAVSISPVPAFAHGGGGHSSGGHHGGSYAASTNSGHGGSLFGSRYNWPTGSYTAAPTTGWSGFPEDLPEARIHRFLQQHLPHPHLLHRLHA
jgi:hypothetical protein